MTHPRRHPVRTVLLLLAALVGGLLVTGPAAADDRRTRDEHADRRTTTNPTSKRFADTFADPSVIRGKDGWWYAYGTSDPLREGEGTIHRIPMAKSRDLVSWRYVGDAFTDATLPSWAESDAGIWAPDIRYVDGEYRLYYVVTETTVTPERGDNAIGVATAPTPTGPWTDSGAPVVGPRRGNGGFLWTFDPSAVTDRDGSQWLFYGSYNGGMFIAPLDRSGRHATGPEQMVAIDNKFEGAYTVRHGRFWYLFASSANCCAGPTTGYSVQVGRSRDLRGPYVDKQGVPLLASRAGGTPTLVQNGNQWIGAGHNAIAEDVTGQDFIVYHALDRADPYLDGTDGINERPMLMDRLDWVDGWPVVRGDRGPSASPQPAPVTRSTLRTERTDDERDGDARPSRRLVRGPVRVEADLSGRAALVVRSREQQVRAEVRPGVPELRLTARAGNRTETRTAPLPVGFAGQELHSVVLEVRGASAVAEMSHARLGDPLARVSLRLPQELRSLVGTAGAVAPGPSAEARNVSVARPADRGTAVVDETVPSRLLAPGSDEFDGDLRPGWEWVREDPDAHVAGGALTWPTQPADLVGTGNDAGVLLRDAPQGDDWAVVTKVKIDLGTDTVRNFQQAGLIAYVDDDRFARLSHVAIFNTRQTEYGTETPYAGRLQYGGTIVGPPAETTWLRLTHTTDRSGERELRAWSSRDGRTWVKGGVWTLPAGSDLRVGLVSHGGEGATAEFDWFRTYR